MLRDKCCYNCDNYVDALCTISDQYDEENPNTFYCDLYGEADDDQ